MTINHTRRPSADVKVLDKLIAIISSVVGPIALRDGISDLMCGDGKSILRMIVEKCLYLKMPRKTRS
jgi:hypothetical protein